MGALMRAHDWSQTGLGSPHQWPQGLRAAIRLMLNTRHPMYIFWGADNICFYNDAYRQSIGTERHPGSLGQPAALVWQETWPIIGPQIAQVMSGGGATWHENQMVPITRNGVREDLYWTYSYGPIDEESAPGGIGGVLVICTETTQQVRGARQLAETEERLQLALSGGRVIGMFDWDIPNDRLIADERLARLHGIDPVTALAGASSTAFFAGIHPDDSQHVLKVMKQALATGAPFSEEYQLIGAGGKPCWILVEGRCKLSEEGLPLRFSGLSFDITDRKIAEEKLRALNAELEAAVIERTLERGRTWQVSPEILGVLNSDGYFEASNPAWQATLGWTQEEIARTVCDKFIHPDDIAASHHLWRDATQHGAPALRFKNRYRRKDGSYCWLSWVAVPVGNKIYCSARDITDEKEQELALAAAEDALRQAQKMEAVGQLTGGLAHDFNNLLMAIGGNLEIIQNRVAQGRLATIHDHIEMAQGAVKRAAALTHRLLAFSRRQTLAPAATDVNGLINGMIDMIGRTVGPGIELQRIQRPDLWTALVDASQLENALLNLCINARDAMPEGGRLSIETKNRIFDHAAAQERDMPEGEYLSLCVRDTGTGMSPDVAAKAFDPFFTTKAIGAGTGLGLSMIYGFAKQSGGQVRIRSVEGKGSVVCIYLPRHHGNAEPTKPESEGMAARPAGSGQTILVVDDEQAIRLLVCDVLSEAGYRVINAADSAEGLNILQSRSDIDLLVTDVGLPGGMNGRQMADAALSLHPALKVVFITGYAETTVLGDDYAGASSTVLTKPFTVANLLRCVQRSFAG